MVLKPGLGIHPFGVSVLDANRRRVVMRGNPARMEQKEVAVVQEVRTLVHDTVGKDKAVDAAVCRKERGILRTYLKFFANTYSIFFFYFCLNNIFISFNYSVSYFDSNKDTICENITANRM